MPRRRIGHRRHQATFEQHNGNRDSTGNPTYGVDADWSQFFARWPCEILSTGGGEMIRGRQITDQTSYVLFGEFFAVKDVRPAMRIRVIGFPVMDVISAYDPDGDRQEMRIEARAEN